MSVVTECPVCRRRFLTDREMRKHLDRKHSDVVATEVVPQDDPRIVQPGEPWTRELAPCETLAGCGLSVTANLVALWFTSSGLEIRDYYDDEPQEIVGWEQVVNLTIGGPGRVTSDGGFWGGGFGVEGAVTGMAVASVLNALTTTSEVHTLVSLETEGGEAFFHYGDGEPDTVRMYLSPAFVAWRTNDHA